MIIVGLYMIIPFLRVFKKCLSRFRQLLHRSTFLGYQMGIELWWPTRVCEADERVVVSAREMVLTWR